MLYQIKFLLSRVAVPNLFGTRDQFRGRVFPQTGVGIGFRMIQALYIYCALDFYYCISSTLAHQTVDPREWGPLNLEDH